MSSLQGWLNWYAVADPGGKIWLLIPTVFPVKERTPTTPLSIYCTVSEWDDKRTEVSNTFRKTVKRPIVQILWMTCLAWESSPFAAFGTCLSSKAKTVSEHTAALTVWSYDQRNGFLATSSSRSLPVWKKAYRNPQDQKAGGWYFQLRPVSKVKRV